MNILIYGTGNFGYAFLKHLDNKNDGSYNLTAYDYNPERVEYLSEHHSHPVFHPNVKISADVEFTNNIEQAIAKSDIILLAVPSTATREAMQNVRSYATKSPVIVNTAKSLDYESGRRLSEVVAEELSGIDHTYALIAGGTIAADLFAHDPLGMDLSCTDENALKWIQPIFESSNLRVYPTTDLTGVEYAAAFKNILSILSGAVSGLGFSYGSETHVISRVAHRIAQACIDHLGAQPETFSIGSQSWGNDMWMSCTGNTRNREFGKLLGQGIPAEEALVKLAAEDKLVEGANTLRIVESVKPIIEIEPIKILHSIAVDQSSNIESLRSHLLRS